MIDIKIMKLIYSHAANDLSAVEIKPEGYIPAGYILITPQMEEKDAHAFVRRMHRKYVKGRKRGRYPLSDIIMLELELFMKLKSYHRKLV